MTSFLENFKIRCQALKGTLALPESEDPRILKATEVLCKEGLAQHVILFGDPAAIRALAKSEGVDLSSIEKHILWACSTWRELKKDVLKTLSATNKKTLDANILSQWASSPLYQAGELLRQNFAHAAVAGSLASTAAVTRAALKTIGTADDIQTVSGSFLFHKPDHNPFLFADSAIVVEPTAEQLADIAWSSCLTWSSLFGDQPSPHVAFLSFSTLNSASHPSVEKVQKAFDIFSKKHPEVSAIGEVQFDAAIDAMVAKRKGITSDIPGNIQCYIFPDLNAGNIAYKIAQRLGGYEAFGPILQGLRQPYADLSRGATIDDIVVTCCLSLLRASI